MFDQAYVCFEEVADKEKLSIQNIISYKLLYWLLNRLPSTSQSGDLNESIDSADDSSHDSFLLYNKIGNRHNDWTSELMLKLEMLEKFICSDQSQFGKADYVAIEFELSDHFDNQNQFLMHKLLDRFIFES